MEDLCDSALLGFGMVTLHTSTVTNSGPVFDFGLYNPRTPPKSAVSAMAKDMETSCYSDVYYLKAAVSRVAVTNISKLLPTYSSVDYATIPYVELGSGATVYFLTGGTRNEASRAAFKSIRPTTKKPKATQEADRKKNLVRSGPIFKITNWVVQLYDFGVYIYIHSQL